MRRAIGAASGVMTAAALVCSGCSSPPPAQTDLMQQVGSITISSEELRVRMSEFAEQFAGEMESAADAVRLVNDDRRIDENALIWKIRMVNMVHDAAFRADPLVSLLDTWVLCKQTLAFVESAAGEAFFGEHQLLMVAASATLIAELEEIASRIGTGERSEEGRARIDEFTAENPLRGRQLRRTSVAAEFAESTGLRATSAFTAVNTLDRRAALLTAQLPFLTEFLPKQLTWQAELSFLQNATIVREELRFEEFDEIEADLDRLATAVEEAPDVVETERAMAVEAIRELVQIETAGMLTGISTIVDGAIEQVRSERELVLEAVADERELVLDEAAALVAAERATVLDDIERQRLETIAVIQGERDEVIVEARTIVTEAVAEAAGVAGPVALRAAGLGGGAIGLGLVLGALILRTGRKHG